MKLKLTVVLVAVLSGVALLQRMAADEPIALRPARDGSGVFVTIKYARETSNFVTLGGRGLFPEFAESKGTRYLLDYSQEPDLSGYHAVISWGDAREKRMHVTGTLEFRPEKLVDQKSALIPVIIVKTLASGPMAFDLLRTDPKTPDNPFAR